MRSGVRFLSLLTILMGFIIGQGVANANDVYLAQNATGSANGSSCANAYAYTFFNASGNWGAGASKIGPGATVHLCGTITAPAGSSNFLMFQGGGASGNPITLLFESGAALTATYWSGAVIQLGGNSYVVVDGGTNGIIQATANGTNLANQQDNGECVASHPTNATNVIVQNLTCANLYVDASVSDNGGEDTYGIDVWGTSNLTIQNNTIHDVKWAFRSSYSTGQTYSNLTFTGNNINNIDHGFFVTDSSSSGSAVMSGFYIYGNTVGSMTNWDNTADNNHHDWFHLNANSTSSTFSNFFLYNNLGYGDVGANANGGFFSYPNKYGTSPINSSYVFNNVFVNTSATHCWANGFVSQYQLGTSLVTNNTFISDASSCNDNGLDYSGSSGITFVNNVVQDTVNASVYVSSSTPTSIDYNDYYASASWYWNGTWTASFTTWKSLCSCDSHTITVNPNLSASYVPTQGSPLVGAATNLYSTCNGQPNPGLGALCYDKSGAARPLTGSWDMGAYQYVSSQAVPPTYLTATAQ